MSAERRLRAACGVGSLAVACIVSSFSERPASAQPAAKPLDKPPAQGSLRSRLGIEAAEPLLKSESTELRLRAFEKLGASGTSGALELLADALALGGAARNANERLVAVRALAPHAKEERARGALVRAMGGALTRDEPADIMVRQTAALALSRSGDRGAIVALAQALRQPGRVSETARVALRAHPPKTLDLLFSARGVPTAALAGLVGDLRYARGRELLQTLSRSGAPALRSEALLALFKVDRAAAVALARGFVKNEKHRDLRLAATRVLAMARDAEASPALGKLLGEPSLVGEALGIALDAPAPAFGPLLARVTTSDPGDVERLFAALGRAGGSVALERLHAALGRAEHAWAAAYALSLATDADAENILERALTRPESRREAARAAALRSRALGSDTGGLDDALEALDRSGSAADRAAAAFCRATLDRDLGARLVMDRDAVVVRSASRASLDRDVAIAAADRLATETNADVRTALALSLVLPEAADRVPTAVLTELLETHGAAAHLAAFALAARDGDRERPRLRELLASGDPLLRSHVALGLSRSEEASAVGLLDDAYRFESDPLVRRAIVTTLGRRTEKGRERTLRLAADLDPDDLSRMTARRALGANAGPGDRNASGTLWLRVVGSPAGGSSTTVVVVTAAGLALPLSPDPDGTVTVSGLPSGSVSVTLASGAPDGDSPKPGSK
jgi:HEAT repeat protein